MPLTAFFVLSTFEAIQEAWMTAAEHGEHVFLSSDDFQAFARRAVAA